MRGVMAEAATSCNRPGPATRAGPKCGRATRIHGWRASPAGRPAVLARRQHHDHLAAFEFWFLLDFGDRPGVGLHALKQLGAELLMRHFAAAEAQGDLDLVAFLEEALHGAHFDLVVMVIDHRPELDLLDLDDLLLFAGFCR